MVILKKIVIMTEHGKSNCSGIVKFENFAGRTSCYVRILGLKGEGVTFIKCGDDVMHLGSIFDGERKFNALYDLNKPIRIIVVVDGEVVCMGSSHGRFSPNAMIIDVNRYLARGEQAIATNTQLFEQIATEQPSTQRCEDIQEDSTACTQSAVEEVATQVEREVEQVVAEEVIEEVEEVAEQTIQETPQPAHEKKVSPTRTAEPFYKKIEKNLNELFEAHEKDEELTLLIPESRWARVPIEGDGYYVVGLIESDGTPNLICYGVPDKDDSNPPKNSSDCRQWMEIEKGGRGYWMMYQSAISGETLTTTIV